MLKVLHRITDAKKEPLFLRVHHEFTVWNQTLAFWNVTFTGSLWCFYLYYFRNLCFLPKWWHLKTRTNTYTTYSDRFPIIPMKNLCFRTRWCMVPRNSKISITSLKDLPCRVCWYPQVSKEYLAWPTAVPLISDISLALASRNWKKWPPRGRSRLAAVSPW